MVTPLTVPDVACTETNAGVAGVDAPNLRLLCRAAQRLVAFGCDARTVVEVTLLSPPAVQLVPAPVAARAVELFDASTAAAWCASAGAALDVCTRRWGLELVAPVCSGRGGLLWRAVSASGRDVAVKVPFVDHVAHFDAQQLLADAGVGPAVVARDDRLGVLATVWVAAAPVGRGESAASAVAEVVGCLADLRDAAPHLDTQVSLPSLSSWLRARLVQPSVDVSPGSAAPSAAERDGALELLDTLSDVASFCHGDANTGNVLVSPCGDVWLVDARGVAGDVCYDVAVFCAKAHRGLPLGAQLGAVSRAALAAGFDVDRCRAWLCIARAAQV